MPHNKEEPPLVTTREGPCRANKTQLSQRQIKHKIMHKKRIVLPVQGTRVQPLIQELRFHVLCGNYFCTPPLLSQRDRSPRTARREGYTLQQRPPRAAFCFKRHWQKCRWWNFRGKEEAASCVCRMVSLVCEGLSVYVSVHLSVGQN